MKNSGSILIKFAKSKILSGCIISIYLLLNLQCASAQESSIIPISGHGVDAVDKMVFAFMEKENVPGSTWAVVKKGKLVMARAYGYADIEKKAHMNPLSIFRVASISKSIAATTILKLISEGKLDLDQKVFEMLPHLIPEAGPADKRTLDITVRHLLNHTAGWKRYEAGDPMAKQREIAKTYNIDGPPDIETVIKWTLTQPLQYTPGTDQAVANITYLILGRIVEKVTGMEYEKYVRENIFAPIGITRPRILFTRKKNKFKNEVTYYPSDNTLVESIFPDVQEKVNNAYGAIDLRIFNSAAGWTASVVDLVKFGTYIDGDKNTPEILPENLQKFMVTDTGKGYGAGWYHRNDTWFHTGAFPGVRTYLEIDPENELVIAVAINRDNISMNWLLPVVKNMKLEEINWPDRDLFKEYK